MAQHRSRLRKYLSICFVVTTSFGLGAAVTAIVLVPVAAIGLSVGIVGLASMGTAELMTALHSGNSERRLEMLIYLRSSLDHSSAWQANPGAADWIRPGVEACTNDSDSKVVAVANEILELLDEFRAD